MGRKKVNNYTEGTVLFSAKGKIVVKQVYEDNEYLIDYIDAGYEKVCKRTYFYQCCEMYDSSVQVGDTYKSETDMEGFVWEVKDDGVLIHFEDGCVDVFANWFDFKNGKVDANGKIVKPKGRRKGTLNVSEIEDTATEPNKASEDFTEESGEASGEEDASEEDSDDSKPEVLKEYANGLVDLHYKDIGVVGVGVTKDTSSDDCYTYMTYDLYEQYVMSSDDYIGEINGIKINADCESVTAYDSYVTGKLRKNNMGEYMKCVAYNDERCDIYFVNSDSVITNIKVSQFDSGVIHSFNKSYRHISAENYGLFSSDDSKIQLGWGAPHKGRLGAIKVGENSIPVKIVKYKSVSDIDIQFKNGRYVSGIDYFTWLYYDLTWTCKLDTLRERIRGDMEFDNPALKMDSNLRIALHRMNLETVSDIVALPATKVRDIPNSTTSMRTKILILKEVAESLGVRGTVKKKDFD